MVLDTCVLNRESVAPGDHEVALVGTGTVTVTDSTGATVATLDAPGTLMTGDETYTFTCTVAGTRTGTATLRSPAGGS